MKYAHVDINNMLLGWYDAEKHNNIPTPNIEVTDEVWLAAVTGEPHNKVNNDGTTEVFDFRTADEIANAKIKAYEYEVQKHLDAIAKSYGYDNVMSACSYAAYTNPYQIEGQSFIAWRGAVWQYAYAQLQLVQTGQRLEPTINELIAELPAFVLIA